MRLNFGQLAAALGAAPLALFVDLNVVRPPATLAVPAIGHWVGERSHVPARLPHSRVHDDRGLDADDVVADLHHRPPPVALDVVLQLDA
jgi:hypothetical protein